MLFFAQKMMWVTEASVTLTVVKDSMGSDILRKKFWVEFVDCVLAGKTTQKN